MAADFEMFNDIEEALKTELSFEDRMLIKKIQDDEKLSFFVLPGNILKPLDWFKKNARNLYFIQESPFPLVSEHVDFSKRFYAYRRKSNDSDDESLRKLYVCNVK